jgi:hypothetical protein
MLRQRSWSAIKSKNRKTTSKIKSSPKFHSIIREEQPKKIFIEGQVTSTYKAAASLSKVLELTMKNSKKHSKIRKNLKRRFLSKIKRSRPVLSILSKGSRLFSRLQETIAPSDKSSYASSKNTLEGRLCLKWPTTQHKPPSASKTWPNNLKFKTEFIWTI